MTYECIACGDTGRNSKGGPCHPCRANGRQPLRDVIVEGIDKLFAKFEIVPPRSEVMKLIEWAYLPRYVYATGFRDADGGMGMFEGPTPDLGKLLDKEPPEDPLRRTAYIVEFTRSKHWGEEDTHKPVARWADGRWQRKRRPDA